MQSTYVFIGVKLLVYRPLARSCTHRFHLVAVDLLTLRRELNSVLQQIPFLFSCSRRVFSRRRPPRSLAVRPSRPASDPGVVATQLNESNNNDGGGDDNNHIHDDQTCARAAPLPLGIDCWLSGYSTALLVQRGSAVLLFCFIETWTYLTAHSATLPVCQAVLSLLSLKSCCFSAMVEGIQDIGGLYAWSQTWNYDCEFCAPFCNCSPKV